MQVITLNPVDTHQFLALRKICLTAEATHFRTSTLDDAKLGFQYWHDRLEKDHVVAIDIGGDLKTLGGLSRVFGEKMEHKGLIWGMYVAPDLRGSGAADDIMQALVDTAKDQYRQLILTLAADNIAAQRFYERHHFTLYAVEPDAIRRDEGFVDESLMWRKL